MIGADHDQGRLGQAAVAKKLLAVGERHHVVGRANAESPCRASRLWPFPIVSKPGREGQAASCRLDVHRHGPTPAGTDHDIGLMPVELGLGDPDGLVEIVIRQGRVEDLVAGWARYVGFTPPGVECQPWRKRIFMSSHQEEG